MSRLSGWASSRRRRAAVALAAAAVLLASASSLVETLSRGEPSPRTLDRLRRTAARIKSEFVSLQEAQAARLRKLSDRPVPADPAGRFALLKALGLDPATEGAALTGPDGALDLWLGQALDLRELIAAGAPAAGLPVVRLVKSKSSSYLVSAARAGGGFAAVFRLLAFAPELQSRYLAEYQFLPPRLRANGRFEYIDFREDAARFDGLFRRGGDEFIGRPGLQGRIQSLFFPLRDPSGRIAATVNIRSRAPAAAALARAEALRLAAGLAALLALLLAAIEILRGCGLGVRLAPRRAAAVGLAATAMRAVLIPLGRLSPLQDAAVLSPGGAGFRSLLGLTRSPADQFATALWLGALFLLAAWMRRPGADDAAPEGRPSRPAARAAIVALAAAATAFAAAAAIRLVLRNSTFNPLEIALQADSLLVFAGLVLGLSALALMAAAAARDAARGLPPALLPVAFLAAAAAARLGPASPPTAILAGLAAAAAALAARPLRRRTLVRASAWVLAAAFFYGGLADAAAEKSRRLAEGFVRDSVQSLESWARFLLNESIPELDRSDKAVRAALRAGAADPALARGIWTRTLPARFNWYSSLELIGPDGAILSRFSLNVPKIFRPAAGPGPSSGWTIAPVTVPFMGRERRFLTAAKDWTEDGAVLGRVLLSLSLDPDLLPFLYSANPYFELLRVNTVPSLRGYDLRFAVLDGDGRLIFNPFKLSAAIPAAAFTANGAWSRLADQGRAFDLYAFRAEGRGYAVFTPRRTWRSHFVGAVRTTALALLVLAPALLGLAASVLRKRRRRLLWSFSERVFLSFLTVSLAPILLFAAFSRPYFNRLFTRQFVEKAVLHADMARGVMDDFLYLDPEAPASPDLPPEDLVLWISNTIGNDVNLYRDGRLAASSRRELFDAGLLPEMLDGEVHYRLRYGPDPTVASETRLGSFPLRTLTVPYDAPGRRLAIALPFPFERRDIATASQELIEFLVFMAVFLLGLVLAAARGVGGRIVEPVRRLLAGTREASLGNLEIAIDYDGGDEMKTLVDGFNAMIRSLKAHQQELADLGRKAAWAEMARKVAHEIKNPLTPIQLSAEHILRVFEDGRGDIGPALRESISYIVGEVEALRRIAQEFLEVSRDPVARTDRVGLAGLTRETAEPYRRLLAERIEIVLEGADEGTEVMGDRDKLKIALRNLLTNAVESIRGPGRIRIEIRPSGAEVLLTVEDSGAGMEPEILQRIFEPYFSTKDVGTGLGLPITRKIVEDHRGSIQIDSAPGRGTRVLVRLPAAPAAA